MQIEHQKHLELIQLRMKYHKGYVAPPEQISASTVFKIQQVHLNIKWILAFFNVWMVIEEMFK